MSTESPSPLSSLKPLAGRALEAALNRALALDPDTAEGLRPLHGRRVVLRLQQPPLALQLTVENDRFRVGPVEADTEPDLAVRTTLAGLIAQLPGMQRSGGGTPGRMRIEGDAELARALQTMARGFDPDWQQPFASVFGEVLGVQIAQALTAALRHGASLGSGLAHSAAEYVVEESRDVVGREELAAFCEDVDVLRDDVERMQARVQRLRAASGAAA